LWIRLYMCLCLWLWLHLCLCLDLSWDWRGEVALLRLRLRLRLWGVVVWSSVCALSRSGGCRVRRDYRVWVVMRVRVCGVCSGRSPGCHSLCRERGGKMSEGCVEW
jgi:hypothetical protein